MGVDEILFEILILHLNESSELDIKTHIKFENLIIELAKVKFDIRYCSNDNCSCHPESSIKKLLEEEQLEKFLKSNKLYDEILNLTENYSKETIYDNKYWEGGK